MCRWAAGTSARPGSWHARRGWHLAADDGMRRGRPHRHARSRRSRLEPARGARGGADLCRRGASGRLSLFRWAAHVDRARRGGRAGAAEEERAAAKEADIIAARAGLTIQSSLVEFIALGIEAMQSVRVSGLDDKGDQ